MPFLTRKAAAASAESLIHGTLRIAGTEWGSDDYKPSRQAAAFSAAGHANHAVQSPARRVCENLECTTGWRVRWRNRRRPIFEGQWGCSGRCVLAMVRAAIRRELSDGGKFVSDQPHRHRVPLGLVMLAQGWITHPQLRRALELQRDRGTGRIGDWLVKECDVDIEHITRALSKQWGCPVLKTEGFSPDEMALVMPKVLVEKFGMLPIRVAGSRILYLGFSGLLDHSVALALEQMTGLKVESGVVDEGELETARKRLLACDEVELRMENAEDVDEMAARITAILEQKQPIASQVVRVHGVYWLRLWLESGAFGGRGTLPSAREDVKDYLFTTNAVK